MRGERQRKGSGGRGDVWEEEEKRGERSVKEEKKNHRGMKGKRVICSRNTKPIASLSIFKGCVLIYLLLSEVQGAFIRRRKIFLSTITAFGEKTTARTILQLHILALPTFRTSSCALAF